MMYRDLSAFSGGMKFSSRIFVRLIFWTIIQNIFFKSFFFPSVLRVLALRTFGASIGSGVKIRRGVKIHFPWNLEIGDDCWIGEEAWFINHEKIEIGSNVCISQRAIICASGHNFGSVSLEYSHKRIAIREGAWICLDAKVLPGVTIGECSVVSAGEVSRKSLPDFSMLIGGQVRPIDPPK